jgi:hypothetical protein
MKVELSKSQSKGKKYKVIIINGNSKKTIHFGQRGAEDYTIHGDKERKKRYIARHEVREDWSINGADSPGFYARWILWNEPSIEASVRDLRKRFPSLDITFKK